MKAVLFDCDGTLVDSEYAHYLSWKKALERFGESLTPSEYYPYIGKPAIGNAEVFAAKIGEGYTERVLQIKREAFEEDCRLGLPPIHTTVNFLKTLGEEKERLGIKIGVCSASKKQEILYHIDHLGIAPFLDIVLSGEEDLKEYSDPEGVNKPKPYIYLHAMKQLMVQPHQSIVIEDSMTGIQAGRAAGCFTIAIPNAYTKGQDLSGAHLYLESLNGINVSDLHALCKT